MNTFNLRRAALYLIGAAIFIAIANILSVFILTSQLKQQQAEAEIISQAAELKVNVQPLSNAIK